ncbi:MAG: O-antigen ligase family protein [Terracidiphilus sp.]
MRKAAWVLLLLFVFSIPWEYSLDLGEPYGNIARILGLVTLFVAIPAAIQAGGVRTPSALQILTLALFLWLCATCFWTVEPELTEQKLRGFAQEMMIVWLVWEFVESPRDLYLILRAWLLGSGVLAALTIANLPSPGALSEGQIRFAPIGQDPNDVARFLDLGFPIAALLFDRESRWPGRLLALGFFPLGIAAVLLTASRGGFLAALAALSGSVFLLMRRHHRVALPLLLAVPLLVLGIWFFIPPDTLARLNTIPDQLQGGDLNQRLNIWEAGGRAFLEAPFFGHGAGSFVSAAGLAPADTAHNTALAILVESGVIGFILACAILLAAVHAALQERAALRAALITLLLTWTVSSLVGTVAENRTTWLLFGVIACAARFAKAESAPAHAEFSFTVDAVSSSPAPARALRTSR